MDAPFPHAGKVAAVACSMLWAVGGLLFTRIGPRVTAGALNLGKNATGAICLLGLSVATTGAAFPSDATPGVVWSLVASGLVGLTLCDTFFLRALLEIGPQRATLFMAFSPVLIALAAMLPPFGEFPPLLAWAGMASCLAGIVLAARRRHADPVQAASLRRGVRDGLLAAVFQSAGLLFARYAVTEGSIDAAGGAQLRLTAGTLGLLVAGFATRRAGRWFSALAHDGAWRRLFVAAFIGTFLGIWANMAALEWSPHTGVASTLSSLAPVFLIPLSAAFLGERQDARAWVSTLLAVAGIALIGLA